MKKQLNELGVALLVLFDAKFGKLAPKNSHQKLLLKRYKKKQATHALIQHHD